MAHLPEEKVGSKTFLASNNEDLLQSEERSCSLTIGQSSESGEAKIECVDQVLDLSVKSGKANKLSGEDNFPKTNSAEPINHHEMETNRLVINQMVSHKGLVKNDGLEGVSKEEDGSSLTPIEPDTELVKKDGLEGVSKEEDGSSQTPIEPDTELVKKDGLEDVSEEEEDGSSLIPIEPDIDLLVKPERNQSEPNKMDDSSRVNPIENDTVPVVYPEKGHIETSEMTTEGSAVGTNCKVDIIKVDTPTVVKLEGSHSERNEMEEGHNVSPIVTDTVPVVSPEKTYIETSDMAMEGSAEDTNCKVDILKGDTPTVVTSERHGSEMAIGRLDMISNTVPDCIQDGKVTTLAVENDSDPCVTDVMVNDESVEGKDLRVISLRTDSVPVRVQVEYCHRKRKSVTTEAFTDSSEGGNISIPTKVEEQKKPATRVLHRRKDRKPKKKRIPKAVRVTSSTSSVSSNPSTGEPME
nr:MAG: hypothetical protein [Penaeus semisulcatus pemonivirus]